MVVTRHVLQYSVSDEGGILTNIIWAIQMPGFMLVSGYFAAKPSSVVFRSIRKNAQRYLLPFLSWWILFSVLLLGGCNRNLLYGIQTLFQHVDGGLWFLWVIFCLSILASVVNRILSLDANNIFKALYLIVACGLFYGMLLVIVVISHNMNIFGIKYILYYSIFYGFGYCIKWTISIWKPLWNSSKSIMVFVSIVVFLAIVYNYDLYHCGDDLTSIVLRCIAGFTGNLVLFNTIEKFRSTLIKAKIASIGKYTLEIYCTHMYVNNLFMASNGSIFWSAAGFSNFIISFICTCIFTAIIIAVFKSVPFANFIMYGKR